MEIPYSVGVSMMKEAHCSRASSKMILWMAHALKIRMN